MELEPHTIFLSHRISLPPQLEDLVIPFLPSCRFPTPPASRHFPATPSVRTPGAWGQEPPVPQPSPRSRVAAVGGQSVLLVPLLFEGKVRLQVGSQREKSDYFVLALQTPELLKNFGFC